MTLSAVWGKSSWFGGPGDKTTGPTTASGAPITDPGIAVDNRATLGHWWAIKAPNGAIAIVKQTDIGPAPSTGRRFDLTYSLLPLLGYTQQNYPTGQQVFGYDLGTTLTDISLNAPNALKSLGATTQQYTAFVQSSDNGAIKNGHADAFASSGKQSTAPGVSADPSSEAVGSGVNVNIPGLSGVESIAALLTSGAFWLRVLEVIAGVMLVAMGLRSLSGTTTTPLTVARGVARRMPLPI